MAAAPRPDPGTVAVPRDELEDLLRAASHVYEVAWSLSDRGRVDFEAFRPIVRVVRTLRRLLRAEEAAA